MNAENNAPAWDGFGAYLRSQRQLARLTLRQLAAMTDISNPYLSQIERGLHKPSLAVLKSIADALNMSVDALLEQAGVVVPQDADAASEPSTETVIRNDPRLSSAQKAALLAVYRSMVTEPGTDASDASRPAGEA
jgi:transcriptional regulator with XRE-family HTH domain